MMHVDNYMEKGDIKKDDSQYWFPYVSLCSWKKELMTVQIKCLIDSNIWDMMNRLVLKSQLLDMIGRILSKENEYARNE